MRTTRRKLKAFSIGEVILAAFILTVGIIAMMRLITSSYSNSSASQDMIIASELAQEGVELVRNIRDNNLAYRVDNWATCQSNWDGRCSPFYLMTKKGSDGKLEQGNGKNCRIGWRFDYQNLIDMKCDVGIDEIALNIGSPEGFYGHVNGVSQGRFYRLIKMNVFHPEQSDGAARILSLVTWQSPPDTNIFNASNVKEAAARCTLATNCVYAELLLESWK